MSILKIRELMNKPGCQVVLFVTMALVAVGLIATSFMGGSGRAPVQPDPIVMVVDGNEVNRTAVEERARNFRGPGMPTDGPSLVRSAKQALDGSIDSALMLSLANELGVSVPQEPEEAAAAIVEVAELQLQQVRQQLEAFGMITPDMTEQEIAQAYANFGVGSPDDFRERVTFELTQIYEDPDTRALAIDAMIQPRVLAAVQATIQADDDAIRTSYDTVDAKAMLFFDTPDQTAVEQAQSALSRLQAGEEFDAVFADVQPSGEPTAQTYQRAFVAPEDDLGVLFTLEPGQRTEIVASGGTAAIYELVSTGSALPEDFDENTQTYRDQFAQREANGEMVRLLEERRETASIEWMADGYRMLFEVAEAQQNATPEQDLEFWRSQADAARTAAETGSIDRGFGALAWYAAQNEVVSRMPGDDEDELRFAQEDYALAIDQVLSAYESRELRFELVDLYVTLEMPDAAADGLVWIAESNYDYEIEGQQVYDEVDAKLQQLQTTGALTAEQTASVQEELDRWLEDRDVFAAEQAEFEAQLRRDQEELERELAELQAEGEDESEAQTEETTESTESSEEPATSEE